MGKANRLDVEIVRRQSQSRLHTDGVLGEKRSEKFWGQVAGRTGELERSSAGDGDAWLREGRDAGGPGPQLWAREGEALLDDHRGGMPSTQLEERFRAGRRNLGASVGRLFKWRSMNEISGERRWARAAGLGLNWYRPQLR